MLDSVNKKIEDILNRVSQRDINIAKTLNNCNIIMKELCQFLSYFNHIIKLLSDEHEPTLHTVLVVYYMIKNEICLIKENEYESITLLKKYFCI